VVIQLGVDVKFYVDGVLRSDLAVKTAAASNGAPFEMGTLPFTYYGNFFTGLMDEVRVYRQALSASAVAALTQ
jgi:Concanavalin A-like lectin/glucanases superfamily